MCYGGNNHCWRNNEQNTREGNDGRVDLGGKMEYLVVMIIALVLIIILDGRRKK